MWTKWAYNFVTLIGLDFHEFFTFCGKNKKYFFTKLML